MLVFILPSKDAGLGFSIKLQLQLGHLPVLGILPALPESLD